MTRRQTVLLFFLLVAVSALLHRLAAQDAMPRWAVWVVLGCIGTGVVVTMSVLELRFWRGVQRALTQADPQALMAIVQPRIDAGARGRSRNQLLLLQAIALVWR